MKFTNKTNKVLRIRCDKCGNINKILPEEECTCSLCKKDMDLSICENLDTLVQSESYYLYRLKAGIINKDENMIKENIDYLDQYESDNLLYQYYKNKKILKNIEDKDVLGFIVTYDILQNDEYSYEDKLKMIRKTKYKDEYVKEFKDKTENPELVEELKVEGNDFNSYDEPFDLQRAIGILLTIFGVLVWILIRVISRYIFKEEVLYPSFILISIVPALIMTIGLSKVMHLKNKIFKYLLNIVIFMVLFLLISYICTMHLNTGNFIDGLNNYFYHLTHCFKEIYDEMGANFEGV